jgi:hypothetical protein
MDEAMQECKRAADEYNAWYRIDARLKEFEKLAWATIERHGWPTVLGEFKRRYSAERNRPEEVERAWSILLSCRSVQHWVDRGHAESTALEMLLLCNEATLLGFMPVIRKVGKTHQERVTGGANSHGMEAEDRALRNIALQEDVERLCASGHSYLRACRLAAKLYRLSADHVKKITKNPKTAK